ncbi:DUF4255 domain-containing protein [Enhygromyxa salina]|uniref:Pvc16 N-terminal domain-containing protein n=1 Tax=Enhygromyxa salina TaxID=215803 RepID=A0A2S9XIJ7_9BACT|nr:DUF4255 domain-containing protein [Enhygromyxa salina]PRP92673.1 hypothetical protein ENSA7_81620 [Enhygromyxa salina]
MALLDLSLVTRSLMKLLELNINEKFFGGEITFTVTPEPPEKVGAVENKVSLFCYHVAEEAFYKNFEGAGSGGRNISRTPMALCLYYILTPHHETVNPEDDALTQQTLMGYALKTMHDYAIIHDNTQIDGQTILQGAMYANDNPLQIIMRPVSPEDSISFWGAEDQQTARLSAYYEVRVVLLEPEETTTLVAPVLSLGTYLYQLGTPHLAQSESALAFTLPSTAGGITQIAEVTPARVSGDVGADPLHNRLELGGHNLAGASPRRLWLRNQALTTAVGGPLPIDLSIATNTTNGWALTINDERLELDIYKSLAYLDGGGVEQSVSMLPGIYTAFLRVTTRERIVGGVLVPLTVDSNEVAFTVIPRIAGDAPDGPSNKVTLTLVDTFDLELDGLAVRLYVDGEAYAAVDDTDNPGQYEITGPSTLIFHALFDVETDGEHAVRLIVNGAESAPYWIETSTP